MDRVCWVDTIPDSEASGEVKTMYDRVRYQGRVENLYMAGSMFPSPVAMADELYKAIMHTPDAPLEAWECELVATYVAILTDCTYTATHHGANFAHYYPGDNAGEILGSLESGATQPTDDAKTNAMLSYTRKLSLQPGDLNESDIATLREAGLDDAQIVHLNQVVANFSYWVRVINGLGIALGEGPIGLHGN